MAVQDTVTSDEIKRTASRAGRFCATTLALLAISAVMAADDVPPGLAGDSANRIHDEVFRTEVVEITLAAGERMEYVLNMEQGESLLYSWQVDKGNLYSDFHSHPDDKDKYPENYWIRYEESEHGGSHGAVVAPFSGPTAWYWVNRNEHPVTVRLELVGYFSDNEIGFRAMPE